jgi:hypothetical protein
MLSEETNLPTGLIVGPLGSYLLLENNALTAQMDRLTNDHRISTELMLRQLEQLESLRIGAIQQANRNANELNMAHQTNHQLARKVARLETRLRAAVRIIRVEQCRAMRFKMIMIQKGIRFPNTRMTPESYIQSLEENSEQESNGTEISETDIDDNERDNDEQEV